MPTITISPKSLTLIEAALRTAKDGAVKAGMAKIDTGDLAGAADDFLAASGWQTTIDAVRNANDGSDPLSQLDATRSKLAECRRENAKAIRQAHGALRAANTVLRVVRNTGARYDVHNLAGKVLAITPETAERVYHEGFDAVYATATLQAGCADTGQNVVIGQTLGDICGDALDDRNLG